MEFSNCIISEEENAIRLLYYETDNYLYTKDMWNHHIIENRPIKDNDRVAIGFRMGILTMKKLKG